MNSACVHFGYIVSGYMDTRSKSAPTISVKFAVLFVQNEREPQKIHTAPRIKVPPARVNKIRAMFAAFTSRCTFAHP